MSTYFDVGNQSTDGEYWLVECSFGWLGGGEFGRREGRTIICLSSLERRGEREERKVRGKEGKGKEVGMEGGKVGRGMK